MGDPVSQEDLEALLALDDQELMARLIEDASEITGVDEDTLRDQIDVPLVTLGLDSLGLAQLKGMLAQQHGCDAPDQWFWFESTTMAQLLIAIRNGGVTEEECQDGVPITPNQDASGGN